MNRWLQRAVWVFFAATMYQILQGALSPWIWLPYPGDITFTLVFTLFALTHCTVLEGGRRTWMFFAVSAVVSWVMEEIGVRTGLVYGTYHYGSMLGAKLGDVPLVIPLAWFMMIYPSWMVARAVLPGVTTRSLAGVTAIAAVAALVMTSWDVVMDPGMAAAGNWTWEHGGAWFGVPRRNYVGWLLTTFPVYWAAGWLWREKTMRAASVTRTFAALPVIVYAFLTVRYVAGNHFPALQMVALFCMGTPSLLALIQLGVNGDRTRVEGLAAG